jgi:NADH:ubiquinone oxidoreductase subunit 4 (subunit M)
MIIIIKTIYSYLYDNIVLIYDLYDNELFILGILVISIYFLGIFPNIIIEPLNQFGSFFIYK